MTQVELLWWEGCPSTGRARDELRAAMQEVGLDPGSLREEEVATDAAARDHAFVGSPTVRIDGRDVEPVPEDEVRGLACRVYRRRDGRISPTPDPEDVRAALRG